MLFADKVIVITGASEGIGAELARQLAREKPKLVLAARRLGPLQGVVRQCEVAGAEAIAVRCDVGVEGDCKALAASALARFSGIDILVNNAGVTGHARLEDVLRVNFMGSVWCTRYALPELRKSKGLVAGISGLAGKFGLPGCTAYSPSKFAQAGFFEALRTEVIGTGVDVTVVFPSFVATNLLDHGYGADGKPTGKLSRNLKDAMPVEDCARHIIAALRGRKRERVMSTQARIGLWLKLLAPLVVDNMARAALRSNAGTA
jgi:short-subunit dehydrogenase